MCMTLELKKTPDILSTFREAAQTDCSLSALPPRRTMSSTYAKIKMGKKDLDMVVANDITKEGAGFNTDTNIATIITRDRQLRSICQKCQKANWRIGYWMRSVRLRKS